VVVLCMAAIAYAIYAESRTEQGELIIPTTKIPVHPKFETRMIAIDREAIDAAYRQQVTALFLNWMKDESGQPGRALHGVERARDAYTRSMEAIDRREVDTLKTVPMPQPKP
jgi:hypothetical protein